MKIVDSILCRLASMLDKRVQGNRVNHARSDANEKGVTFSVESMMSESLADLITMQFTLPVDGDNERAKWLDDVADSYVNDELKKSISLAFLTGDSVVIPSWNGRSMDNIVVDASSFEILSTQGNRITSMVYAVDERVDKSGSKWMLMQLVELIKLDDGTHGNLYKLYCAKNNVLMEDVRPSSSGPWSGEYEADEWIVPGVDRLLVGRFKSCSVDPLSPNSVRGIPICFGASQFIGNIHYIMDQIRVEFELSEKAIMASKNVFSKAWKGDEESEPIIPRGADRLFMLLKNGSQDNPTIHDWSPDIRYEPYRDALEKQLQLVEKAVGVSSGIISDPSNVSYENVDNVRKSQQKTMGFVNAARKAAQTAIDDLLYAWDVLANYYDITPMGRWQHQFNWSDEYVETFADKQNAILAGEAIGATDAVDYRQFLFNEPPDVAKARVDEITAAKADAVPTLALGA